MKDPVRFRSTRLQASEGPGMAAPIAVLPMASVASTPDLIEEWRDLAASLPHASYFQTPDWVLGWWESVGERAETDVALWRDESGRLTGLIALSENRGRLHRRIPIPVRRLILAGSGVGAADHCGWLAAPGWETPVFDWLLGRASRSAVLLHSLDTTHAKQIQAVGATEVEVTHCPRLDIDASLDDLRAKSRYKRVRRYERSMGRKGVTYEFLEGADVGSEEFTELVRLHTLRREMLSDSSHFGMERLALHDRLVTRSTDQRGPWALVARHEGKTIGTVYGFRWGQTWSSYQIGWNPEWANSSLGSVLMACAVETAVSSGATVFDFLRGTDTWKYDFLGEDRPDTTWLIGRGLSANLMRFVSRLQDMRDRQRQRNL